MILGVTGRAGSGKDTVADILVRDHGFCKVAFADKIKRVVGELFQFTDEQLWGPSSLRDAPDFRYPRGSPVYRDAYEREKERNPELAVQYAREGWLTPRYALQRLGTEYGRHYYDKIWVEYTMRVVDALLTGPSYKANFYSAQSGLLFVGGRSRPKGVVISDVRFPNEVAAIRAKGGRIWKTTHGAGLQDAAGAHESESYIDSLVADDVVPDSSLEALLSIVATMLEKEVLRVKEALK